MSSIVISISMNHKPGIGMVVSVEHNHRLSDLILKFICILDFFVILHLVRVLTGWAHPPLPPSTQLMNWATYSNDVRHDSHTAPASKIWRTVTPPPLIFSP